MEQLAARAQTLVEALPYIRKFHDAVVVIKYGGAAMVDNQLKAAVLQDIVLLWYVGMRPVLVHGGGPEVSALMKRLGMQPEFVRGLRVTDQGTMEVAEMVLGGKINKDLVDGLNQAGGRAVGLSGKDDRSILARKLETHEGQPIDLGFVGDIVSIRPDLIRLLVDHGYIPVLSSIGVGVDGTSYNINADTLAGRVAAELGAAKFVMLTDVRGILRDPRDEGSLVGRITAAEVGDLIADGTIDGGMIPKVAACLEASQGGVPRVHIIDGRIEHGLLMEIFTDRGIGTLIAKDAAALP
ncbi:MAG: acetylglutamate kinase [Fimbriimonadaceae bacterium]|nr:acetylglutamate kinase [Fimbriimonadaceae bacterium]